MKKILAILLVTAALLGLTACGGHRSGSAMKVGFIYLHDENSAYDRNFMDAAKAACEKMGVEYVEKTNVAESDNCYDAAVALVFSGCDIVFADSFDHEAYMLKAAKEFPHVQFCHATGTSARTEDLDNFHNAFASIYQGRYLAGVAAGLKLNQMIENKEITAEQAKMGYVGAFTNAEVVSGYTAFYLGARSVCPTVTMDVQFTGSWYNEQLEKETATALISKGSVLISQHVGTMAVPAVCEAVGVPNVAYNGSTEEDCPDTFIISSRINWEPYFEYMITCVKEGKAIDKDWTGTLESGSVELSSPGAKAPAAGTADKLASVKAALMDGTVNVFDTSAFTVDRAVLTTYKADLDPNVAGAETEVIVNGIFEESKYRSAPYFDLRIEGITLLNEKN